jgi:hypothetical protein
MKGGNKESLVNMSKFRATPVSFVSLDAVRITGEGEEHLEVESVDLETLPSGSSICMVLSLQDDKTLQIEDRIIGYADAQTIVSELLMKLGECGDPIAHRLIETISAIVDGDDDDGDDDTDDEWPSPVD